MSLDLLVSEVSPLFGGECPCVAIISDCVIILDIISDVIFSDADDAVVQAEFIDACYTGAGFPLRPTTHL